MAKRKEERKRRKRSRREEYILISLGYGGRGLVCNRTGLPGQSTVRQSQNSRSRDLSGWHCKKKKKKRKEKKRGLLVITATGRQAVEPAGGLQGRIHTLGDAILPFLD